MKKNQTTALALYSGGLDSTLACRVVAQQDIKVVAVKFVTPFFGYDLLFSKDDYIKKTKEMLWVADEARADTKGQASGDSIVSYSIVSYRIVSHSIVSYRIV